MATQTDHFGALPAWQQMLDRYSELFSELDDGARIGIVSRAATTPGRAPDPGLGALPIMVWQAAGGGLSARIEPFAGMSAAAVDLLLAANEEAMTALRDDLNGDTLTAMKRHIRRGSMLFFVFRTKSQLRDAGYEDFLESLGLAFLGACR